MKFSLGSRFPTTMAPMRGGAIPFAPEIAIPGAGVFPIACLLFFARRKEDFLKCLCFFLCLSSLKLTVELVLLESTMQSAKDKETAHAKQKTSAIFHVGLASGGR